MSSPIPSTEPRPTPEILRAAANLLRSGRWRQGPRGASGRLCVRHALHEVAGYGAHFDEAADALREAIGTHSIIRWNDTKGRTADEVIAALEKAATLAEADPTPVYGEGSEEDKR